MGFQRNLPLDWHTTKMKETTSKKQLQDKLKFAIKKREIISEEMKRLQTVANGLKGIPRTNLKRIKKPRLTKPKPFIKHYLKVYRELCGKCDKDEILKEADRRWSLLPKETISKETNPLPSATEKVELALRKRNIVAQEMNRLSNLVQNLKRKKQQSNNFLKFYLAAYRELCGKCDPTEIVKEAEKKWKDHITNNKGTSRIKLRNLT